MVASACCVCIKAWSTTKAETEMIHVELSDWRPPASINPSGYASTTQTGGEYYWATTARTQISDFYPHRLTRHVKESRFELPNQVHAFSRDPVLEVTA